MWPSSDWWVVTGERFQNQNRQPSGSDQPGVCVPVLSVQSASSTCVRVTILQRVQRRVSDCRVNALWRNPDFGLC